jgi:hypothetical protein
MSSRRSLLWGFDDDHCPWAVALEVGLDTGAAGLLELIRRSSAACERSCVPLRVALVVELEAVAGVEFLDADDADPVSRQRPIRIGFEVGEEHTHWRRE